MKSLTYAAFIAFVTVAAAAAQPSNPQSSPSAASSASSGQEPGQGATPQSSAVAAKAQRHAEKGQVEDRITAQLNRQQLANSGTSVAPSPRSTVPQTASQPSD